MIEKRIKKIFKISFLIGIRQILLLGKNIYHLKSEPLTTLEKIKKDKSQKFLLFIVIFMPLLIYGTGRLFWDYYRFGTILNAVGMFFYLVITVEIAIWIYFGYWIMRVILKKDTTKGV